MKTKILIVWLLMTITWLPAQDFQWAQGFGFFTSDYCSAVTVDHDGFVYITGYADGNIIIGSCEIEGWGMYVAKFEPNGNCVWAKESTGSFNTQATAIVCDNQNNVIVTGYYSSSISFEGIFLPGALQPRMFLVKYSAEGNLIWAKSYGSPGDTQSTFTNSITTDNEGMIYVTGAFNRFLVFDEIVLESKNSQSSSHFDIFLAKLNPDGDPIWAMRAGGKYNDYAYSLTFDISGNICVAGVFQPKEADFGNILLNYANTNDRDFIFKVDTDGNAAWVTHGEAGYNGFGESVNVTTDLKGNVYACGNYFGSYIYGNDTLNGMGYYLIKLDSLGNKIFIRPLPTSYAVSSFPEGSWWNKQADIKTDQDNNVFITSSFTDTLVLANDTLISLLNQYNWGSADIFVAKYNEIGYPQWAVSAGGTWQDFAYTLANDSSNFYLAGYYSSLEATFGDTVIFNNSGNLDEDFFLARIVDTTSINKCPDINPVIYPSYEVICVNDSVMITCESNYGSIFQWIINDTINILQYSNILWVKDSSTVSVIVNPNTVCPDTSNQIILRKHPKLLVNITALPDTIVCQDSSVLLSTPFNPIYEYTWYLDNEIISTGAPFYEATSEGTYKVMVNDTLCFDTDTIVLTAQNLPNVELNVDTIFTSHFPFNFMAYGSEGQYTWYFSTDTIPISYEPVAEINQQGQYYVLLTNECGSAVDSLYVKDPSYNIGEPGKQGDDLILFIDYANHILTIRDDSPFNLTQVRIFNHIGQLVLDVQNPDNTIKIPILKPGIFMVLIDTEYAKFRRKIFIR